MTCCEESIKADAQLFGAHRGCQSCDGPGRPVIIRTMFRMLKPEFFDQVGENQYRFCASPECPVVYFSEGRSFSTRDLRVRVGLKEKEGPIPLCYCFGFSEQTIREEIAAEGQTTIPQRITALIKERMCACEERNPSGGCCLGEVTKAVKRLMKEVNLMFSGFQGVIPVLPVADVDATLNYYRDVLGFSIEGRHLDDSGEVIFGSVFCGQANFYLSKTKEPIVPNRCYVFADEVDDLCATLKARGARILDEPADKPWGYREFTLVKQKCQRKTPAIRWIPSDSLN